MTRNQGADVQLLEAFHDAVHLARHRSHQTVIEVTSLLLSAAAVRFGPGVCAQVGAEKFPAHQKAESVLEGQQSAGPAGRWSRKQQKVAVMSESQALLLANHPQWRQRGKWWLLGFFAGSCGFALAPELFQQLCAWIRGNQLELGVNLSQAAQQRNSVRVHVTHHHQEWLFHVAQQGVELRQEHGAIGRPWRMDEHGSGSISGFEQHAVGGTAAL